MESKSTEITHDITPFFRVYNTGRIERCFDHDFVPPSHDSQTGVTSRDVVISPENNVSVRLYLPAETDRKLPLIVYIHGGAFAIESAFSTRYHSYANSLASESRSVVVSIEYRLAPEHPIPACYDDCYEVLKWIDSKPDPWLNEHADLERVFMAGDSAGANIVHNMAIRADRKFSGLILIHPFFGTGETNKLWEAICPGTAGANANDVRLYPMADMDHLVNLGSNRVLICVAEKDFLRERGWKYYEGLKKSNWKGVVEFFETTGEGHVFHLLDPISPDNSSSLMKRILEFINSAPLLHVMSNV